MLGSDEIHIDPAYRAVLADRRLVRVGEILGRVDGQVAAWSRSTDTIHVPGPNGEPGFYVKRYYYPNWRKRVRTMFRGTFFGMHRGQAEYRALHGMRALGISAARPVAYGARRCGHFVTACFLITEEVPEACNLTTYARRAQAGRERLTAQRRRMMVQRLAAQVAHMHRLGFAHRQLFWRNVLIRHNLDGSPEFFFLDAQPRPWRQLGSGKAWWQRELALLAVSARPFTTRTERLRFLLDYFHARRLTPELKAGARTIAALSDEWQGHEQQRIKMNDLFNEWNRRLEEETAAAVRPAGPAPPASAEAGTQA